jgi:hypothetical protein
MESLIVDLALYHDQGVGVLAGRSRGERVRKDAGLEDADRTGRRVVVVIPGWVYSVNSSFSLGLVESSIVKLGEDEFRRRYEFQGPDGEAVMEDAIVKARILGSPLAGRRR